MKYEGFIGVVQARFPDADAEKFRALEALYLDWNAKINVISRKDMDSFYPHHVLHSLCIAAFLQEERPEVFARWQAGGLDVLDLGTGEPPRWVFPTSRQSMPGPSRSAAPSTTWSAAP